MFVCQMITGSLRGGWWGCIYAIQCARDDTLAERERTHLKLVRRPYGIHDAVKGRLDGSVDHHGGGLVVLVG
jgi:hypothetical protein